jgi:ribonuclease-3
LGYTFIDDSLLTLALTHRSCGSKNNERLEFLGDSILNFVIGEALFEKFEGIREGQLSRLRSLLVKGETLAEVAREFELGTSLILGEGERKSGGNRRDSILADTVEALIGAIHIDGGFEQAKARVLAWYADRLKSIKIESPKDPKTQLQEILQARKQPLPEYSVVELSGEAHSQEFTVECHISLVSSPVSAKAPSRRAAEQKAAQAMLQQLTLK